MKRITLASFTVFLSLFTLQAQTTLRYETHGKVAESKTELLKFEDVTPGNAGENQTWDFSTAKILADTLPVHYIPSIESPKGGDIAFQAKEGKDKSYFFKTTSTERLYLGVTTDNAEIRFPKPILDVSYPFAYGAELSGKMDGTYKDLETDETVAVFGDYQTIADGSGTLITPDGKKYENVLRVKVVRDYDQAYKGTMYHFIITTYKYYISTYPYPILSTQYVKYSCDCACNADYQRNYFNPNPVLKDKVDCKSKKLEYVLYPNPVENELNIDYKVKEAGKIKMDLVDISGKELEVLVDKYHEAGSYNIKVNVGKYQSSILFLRLKDKMSTYNEKILKKNTSRKK